MKAHPRIVVDFETKGIKARPDYPPEPVGVSIKWPGKKARYYAWGHLTKNNCTKEQGRDALVEAYNSPLPKLFHNSKFDVDVAEIKLGLPMLSTDKIEDTQFLLFLLDPHSFNLGLKQSAEQWLEMPPEERDAVFDWLVAHQADLKAMGHIPKTKKLTANNAGEFIWLAPGDLAGKYADGDVIRTDKLFDKLWPIVNDMGMLPAYRREVNLMPILLRNERQGMRCDQAGLERDMPVYEKAMLTAEQWLRKTLKAPDLDFGSDKQLADVLEREGVVTEWSYTAKTGQKSMNKKTLKPTHFHNKKVFQVLGYRNKLETCLGTYYRPWIETAAVSGGLLYAGWNQTRNDRDAGARTGRLSSSPNFMAVAKSFEDKGDGWSHPDFLKTLPHLPLMRAYILPDHSTHLWGRRDYNQQELRIMAHFEDGALAEAYRKDPRLDVHQFVQTKIKDLLGIDLPRTPIKTLNFGLIYGQGVASMADKIQRTVQETQSFRNAQFSALPGLKDLDKETKSRGKREEPITTWGGRQYFCEEPRVIDGRFRTFEYKLLNYLIQGSAADCTKEALIRYDSVPHEARFVVTVHDEVNISAHKKILKKEMLLLRECMMSVEFDVPMLSDGEFGPNWHAMTKLPEPQPDFSRWR